MFLHKNNFFWQREFIDDFNGKNLKTLKESTEGFRILKTMRSYGLYEKSENILERWKDPSKHVQLVSFLIDYFEKHDITNFKQWSMCFANITEHSTTHISLLQEFVKQLNEKKRFFNENNFSRMNNFFQFLTLKIKNNDMLSIIENKDDEKIKGCSSWNLFAGYWFASIVDELIYTQSEDMIFINQQKKYLHWFLTEVKDVNWFVKKDGKTGWYQLWLHYDRLLQSTLGQFFDNDRKGAIGSGELWNIILDYPQVSSEFKTTIRSVMNSRV